MKRSAAIYTLFIMLFANHVVAQKDFRQEGDKFYEGKDYKNALTAYFVELRANRNDSQLLFKIGITYLYTETKSFAVSYLEKAYKLDPEVDADILYYLGMAYQSNHQYANAKFYYEQFKKRRSKKYAAEIDDRIKECMVSHGLLSNPLNIVIENVGSSINSPFNDYAPISSPDGSTLIFTSDRSTDSIKIRTKTNYEDIYVVKKEKDEWGVPQKISPNININSHDAAASLSPDGKTLFIYYSVNSGDLFTSTLSGANEWSKPVPLGKNINTPTFQETSASITADGKKLFFSSNRPGGKGGLDIYMSELDANGNWGKAVNLGAVINSGGNEDSPYIHPDGLTLYFSSDGHPGMGNSDIFKAEFKNEKWQKPQNMGYPINSIEYDGFFSISQDNKVGYFATMRKNGVGKYDVLKAIFGDPAPPMQASETIQASIKNDPIVTNPKANPTILKGKVLDKISSSPLEARISLVNNKTHQVVTTVKSKSNGEFELTIPESGDYGVTAEQSEYLFNSINVKVPEGSKTKELRTTFVMVKATVGSKVTLKNIFFDTGKSDLRPESISELENIKQYLTSNPKLKVQINGHTDNVGDASVNKSLSLKRALAVVDYLKQSGIEDVRLLAKGYGSERPIASNDDEKDGRALNRRTEIEIVDTGTK